MISIDDTLNEWNTVKQQIWNKIKNNSEYTTEWNIMNNKNKDKNEILQEMNEKTKKLFNWVITSESCGVYPNVKVLFLIATILPLISSDAERVFSLSSLIHTAIRNKLSVEHVKKLIVVHMHGGKFSDLDSENILKWYVIKKKNTDI